MSNSNSNLNNGANTNLNNGEEGVMCMENKMRTITNVDGVEVTFPESLIVVVDGKEMFRCPECNDLEPIEEITVVDDGRFICASCSDWSYTYCEYHNRMESIDDNQFVRLPNGKRICMQGLEESPSYTRCERCGEIIETNSEDAHYDEETDAMYCSGCYRSIIRERNEFVQSYHAHKSQRVKLKYASGETNKRNTLKFGFELEVDQDGDNDYENDIMAKEIHEIMNEKRDDTIYFERDGSLNYGFELITQPMTIKYIEENKDKFKAMLKALRSRGYYSHNGGRCGLHIHATKSIMGEKAINELAYFMELNHDEIRKFSRRRDFGYCEFMFRSSEVNHNPNFKEQVITRMQHDSSRYRVVNTNNDKTVEVRVYRGSLKDKTFFATLSFNGALCEYCRVNEVTPSTTMKTIVDWAVENNYPFNEELVAYCKERKLSEFVEETASARSSKCYRIINRFERG